MDFTSRHSQSSERPAAPAPAGVNTPAVSSRASEKKAGSSKQPMWLRVAQIVLLFVGVLLVAAVLLLIYTERPQSENRYIDDSKLQAVFLNTNQVYFGKLSHASNKEYFVLSDIYYLQTSSSTGSTSSNSSVSLVKLGCELHQPTDQMVINRDQVTFWENINDGGQVAKAVAAFAKANPNGQKCSTATQTNSTNVQGNASTTGTGATTGTTGTGSTTGTTKP